MDLAVVRENHLSQVINHVRQTGSISRAEIVRITNLSATTVSSLVSQVLESGFVYESQKGASSGGRPPVLLEFNYKHRHVIGVGMDSDYLRLVIMDLRGEVVANRAQAFDVDNQPQGTTQTIVELIRSMMDEVGLQSTTILGIGVAVPAPLEGEKLERLSPVIMPKWRDFDFVGQLQAVFQVPIHLENDANAGALAVKWWGIGKDFSELAFIKLGIGVGCGLVIDNKVYRGGGGTAGEIGHTTIHVDGPLCRCGNRGCLEGYVGVHAIIEQVRKRLLTQTLPTQDIETELRSLPISSPIHDSLKHDSIEAIIQAALHGDPICRQVMVETGNYLGIAVANLLNLFNPQLVVLSGDIAAAGSLLADAVQQSIKTHAISKAAQEARLVFTLLDTNSVAVGAATLAIQAAFHPSNLLCTLSG